MNPGQDCPERLPPTHVSGTPGADGVRANRREFVGGSAMLVGAGVLGLGGFARNEAEVQAATPPVAATALTATPDVAPEAAQVSVRFTVNGNAAELNLDPRMSLLDTLREQLGVNGPKKGCDHGQCGACTVHIDGRRVVSCLTLAAQVDGREVLTIEGLAGPDGELHPMQQAFIDHDALQCGYCTPGQIMSAIAVVQEGNISSDAAIREAMSGNLCRCGAYIGITQAIRQVAIQNGGAG